MGYFYAIAAAIVWGFVYTIDQKILDKISPPMFLLINSIFSIILLVPFLFLRSNNFKIILSLDKTTLKFVFISIIFTLVANLLIYLAIGNLGSSKTAIFEIAYPFFVIIFSIILFQTTINPYFYLGSLLIFIGSAIIIKMS